MNHKILVSDMFGTTVTQLASSSRDKKKLEMIVTLGENHSPHVQFRVIKDKEIFLSSFFSFLHHAVEEYNK